LKGPSLNGGTPFLATIAREEFWDTSKPIVFLGNWCTLYSRRAELQSLNATVLPSPWMNREFFRSASRDLEKFYAEWFSTVSGALNHIHGANYGERYWKIFAGPWIRFFLGIVYDRYHSLKIAAKKFPDFTTFGLSEKSHMIPTGTRDFGHWVNQDLYNLQIYTDILKAMGRDFPTKTVEMQEDVFGVMNQVESERKKGQELKLFVKQILGHTFNLLCKIRRDIVVLENLALPRSVQMELLFRTGGRVLPLEDIQEVYPHRPPDWEKRGRISEHLEKNYDTGSDGFKKVAVQIFTKYLPKNFIENYPEIQAGRSRFPDKPRAIASEVGHYFHDRFKEWAASCVDKGTRLVLVQHGGNFGALEYLPSEVHELDIADRYISWGWEREGSRSKVVPLPSGKLMNWEICPPDNRAQGILMLTTQLGRYVVRIRDENQYWFEEYMEWEFRFVSGLEQEALSGLRIRPYHVHYGWDYLARWENRFPQVPIEKWDVTFQDSLKKCRLFVCDYLSTTYVEALSANKPTVLFWNPDKYGIRNEAKPLFNNLRNVGILHDSPEEAAQTVNRVYGDVEKWWADPDLQNVRKQFCYRFARTDPNASALWLQEIKALLNDGAPEKFKI